MSLPFLRLVRLPNALTTIADVVAGAAIGAALSGSRAQPTALACQGIAVVALYAFGMALNDWADREKDATLHPQRPLPSGEVSPRAAIILMVFLVVAALGLAAFLGPKSLIFSAALIGAIVAYDVVLKDTGPPASMAMGLCRALSLSLGIGIAGGWGSPQSWSFTALGTAVWAAPLAYFALIFLVTTISTWEERPATAPTRRTVYALLTLAYLAPVLSGRWPIVTAALGIALAFWVMRPGLGSTPRYGLVIRNAIFTLVFFDALLALGAGDLLAAAICVAIYPLVPLLAKTIGQRGS